MTYLESAQGQTISHSRAIQELNEHGIFDSDDFYDDMGQLSEYSAADVLQWLGY